MTEPTKTWHRSNNDVFGSEALMFPRRLPGLLGVAGIGLLTLMRAWCSQNRTSMLPRHVVEGIGRAYKIGQKPLDEILALLVEQGFFVREGDVYRLIDLSVIGAEEPAAKVTGSAARSKRWREKNKGRDTGSPPVSERVSERVATLDEMCRDTGGDTPTRSPPVSPPVSPSVHAQVHVHAHAHEGEPGCSSDLETKEAALEPEPQAPAPAAPTKPDAVAPKAKAPKAKPGRAIPPRRALAAAHAAGVSAATGAPCAPTTDRWQLDALEAACAAHGAGQVGAALLGWLEGEAKSFALAKAGDAFAAGNGFAPKLFASWLNGGRLGAPRADVDAQPPPRLGPMERNLPPDFLARPVFRLDLDDGEPLPGESLGAILARTRPDLQRPAPPTPAPGPGRYVTPEQKAAYLAQLRAERPELFDDAQA